MEDQSGDKPKRKRITQNTKVEITAGKKKANPDPTEEEQQEPKKPVRKTKDTQQDGERKFARKSNPEFEKEENGRKYHRVECSYGTFSRSFTLPETADEKKINADYKDGVLSVHIGKGTNVKSKSVEVKVS